MVIVDGSVAVTGALVSAARQANLLRDHVDTVLVLPRGHRVPSCRLTEFKQVIELPIMPLRRTILSVIGYLPALIAGSLQLRLELRRLRSSRVQLNDFYLLHGAALRLLGFREQIVTFVRIDPTRFGVAGRIWLKAAGWSSTEIVAVSRFIRCKLGSRVSTRVIYEHIDTKPKPCPSSTQTLLLIGNFIDGKGQDHAVAAFKRIADKFPDSRLRLVGGDMGLDKNRAYRAKIERDAAIGPGAKRIEFLGLSNDPGAEYAKAFAGLNFSASESFSITCLDASAAGLPVIATRCGGPEEIIEDGKTGFLVAVGDVAAMADRMAWLLAHPDKAAAMGVEGRMLVSKRFSPERAKAELISALSLAKGGALR